MSVRNNRFLISFVLCIVTILTACQPQSTSQPSPATPALTATVKEITGTVTMKQPGAGSFSPASVGAELQVSGSVQTGDDGRARLDLSTGTIIRVAPSSLFTLTSNQPSNGSLSTQLNLNAGGVFIILNGGNANVNTPSGVASVRGSYLSVFIDPSTKTIVVTCLEGQCGAGNSAGNVDFGTGQAVTLFSCTAGQCTVPSVGPMTPEEFQNWLDNNPDIQQIPGLFATMTALAATQPSATETPANTPTPGSTATPVACLNIKSPSSSSNQDPAGPIHFSWDPKDGASQYKLTIHYPGGATASFYTDKTSVKRYLESMPDGGTYSWDITAYDGSGHAICQTGEGTFTKPKTETPVPNKPIVCTAENASQYSKCSCSLPRNLGKPWCEE
ncbi:MAG TPA: FecR domain-containing protein [Anaerolineales bacterium]|nr:FecR domain-containing protein [Anaerolineales bacterium]